MIKYHIPDSAELNYQRNCDLQENILNFISIRIIDQSYHAQFNDSTTFSDLLILKFPIKVEKI